MYKKSDRIKYFTPGLMSTVHSFPLPLTQSNAHNLISPWKSYHFFLASLHQGHAFPTDLTNPTTPTSFGWKIWTKMGFFLASSSMTQTTNPSGSPSEFAQWGLQYIIMSISLSTPISQVTTLFAIWSYPITLLLISGRHSVLLFWIIKFYKIYL